MNASIKGSDKMKNRMIFLLSFGVGVCVFVVIISFVLHTKGDKNLWVAIRAKNAKQLNAVLEENPKSAHELFNGMTPVLYCISTGFPDGIEIIYRHGGDINIPISNKNNELHGLTPAHLAIVNRDSESLRVLLKLGADIDIKNKEGTTVREILGK